MTEVGKYAAKGTMTEVGTQNNSLGLQVIKLFSCSTQLSMKFQLLIKTKMKKNKIFFLLQNKIKNNLQRKKYNFIWKL